MVEERIANPAYKEFAAFIQEETRKAREEKQEWLQNPDVNSVGCVDKLTKKGAVNPPGGGMFLFNERLLDEFLSAREGRSGELFIHDYCGYMRVVMGIGTLKEQKIHMKSFESALKPLQEKYHTHFRVVHEDKGSAKPYMK